MFDMSNLVKELEKTFLDDFELSENGQAIYVKREKIVSFIQTLKDRFNFVRLADITSADYEDRYEVVYHLLDEEASLLCVKVKLDKNDCVIPSIVSIWKAADPQEREIYDLMGIIFEGHGNLKRILCPDNFEGHPLRKDFKLDIVKRF